MKNIEIKDEYITLGQFLKIADLVSTGGEVKEFLLKNEVFVNDLKENRRGRKLYKVDNIKIFKIGYKIC